MTHGECRNPAGSFEQNRVAQTLRVRGTYLPGEVKTRAKCVSYILARKQGFVLLRHIQLAEARPSGRALSRRNGGRHDCGKKTGIKAVLLIQTDVLRALREGE